MASLRVIVAIYCILI